MGKENSLQNTYRTVLEEELATLSPSLVWGQTEKLPKIGLETISALVRVSDPK